jgi:hypothetical protein
VSGSPTGVARLIRTFGFALTLGLSVVAASIAATQPADAVRKNEFKLLVTATDAATVLKTLGLQRQRADSEIVYYFDTSDKLLQAHHVTLRARQSTGHSGDSIVKLRALAGTLELSDAERELVPEQDWTDERQPSEARSLSRKHLKKGLVDNVGSGAAPVAELFTDAQRQLVQARVPGVAWDGLQAFGPIDAEVWSRQAQLAGFATPVTVELWHLRQQGRSEEILEVSAKVSAQNDAEAQAQARQFFAAAKAAGLGEPNGQTKTQLVMDFFSTLR